MSALETAQESKDSHPAGCELDNAVGILKLKLETEFIQPLPPPAANLAGSSSVSGRDYRVTVSNKAGYLCHVQVETRWPVPPEVPFGIFTYPGACRGTHILLWRTRASGCVSAVQGVCLFKS